MTLSLPLVIRKSPRPLQGLLWIVATLAIAAATWHWWHAMNWIAATFAVLIALVTVFSGLNELGSEETLIDLDGVRCAGKAPILGASDWAEPLSAYQGILHQPEGKHKALIVLKHKELLLQGHNVELARCPSRETSRAKAEQFAATLGLGLLEKNAAGEIEVTEVESDVASATDGPETSAEPATAKEFLAKPAFTLRSDGMPTDPFPKLGSLAFGENLTQWVITKRGGQQSTFIFLASALALLISTVIDWIDPNLIPKGQRVPIYGTIVTMLLGSFVALIVRWSRRERLEVGGGQLIYSRATLGLMRVRERYPTDAITSVRAVSLGIRGGSRHRSQAFGLVIRCGDRDLEIFEELDVSKQHQWLAAALSSRLGCASATSQQHHGSQSR